MRVTLDIDLPMPLYTELAEASKEARIHPELFAAECVEATLAARRLPYVRPAVHGARILAEGSL